MCIKLCAEYDSFDENVSKNVSDAFKWNFDLKSFYMFYTADARIKSKQAPRNVLAGIPIKRHTDSLRFV